MDARTTRERIADALREGPETATGLAERFAISRSSAIAHVGHVARSVDGTGEELLVRPPTCRDCGFDGFDDPLNVPSRCPECKSEAIEEPAFTIESRGQ
ncbi:MAG: transcriptional regulator [Halanaeroarchaeum sp.]